METVNPKTKITAMIRIVFHIADLPFLNAPRANERG